jgi:hypothetical protein
MLDHVTIGVSDLEPSIAFTQRLSAQAGATTASQGFGQLSSVTTTGHLSSIRTATN